MSLSQDLQNVRFCGAIVSRSVTHTYDFQPFPELGTKFDMQVHRSEEETI